MRLHEEEMQEEQKGVRAKDENLVHKLHKSSHHPMLLVNDTVIYNTMHAIKASSTENMLKLAVSKVNSVAKLGFEVAEVEAAPAVPDELVPVPDALEGLDELEFEELDELPGATPAVVIVAGSEAFPTNKACTTANTFICCPRPVSPSELAVVHLNPHWSLPSHCLTAACADAVSLGRMSELV